MIPFCQSRNSTCWPATSSQEVGRPVPAATTPLHTWSTITGSPSLVIASGTWPSGPANTKQEAQCFCSPHTDIRTSSSVILSFCHCTPVSRTHASGDNTWTSGCRTVCRQVLLHDVPSGACCTLFNASTILVAAYLPAAAACWRCRGSRRPRRPRLPRRHLHRRRCWAH